MKKILISCIALIVLSGCIETKIPTKPTIQTPIESTQVIEHKDLIAIVPSGFKDACRECHDGYTEKVICGKYWNPACQLNTQSKGTFMKKIVAKPNGIKNDGRIVKPDVRTLKKGELIKIEVPANSVILIKSKNQ